MAIILPLHCHYSVFALRSGGGSAGSSHLRVPQWLQCGGPSFSAANALLLLLRCYQTTRPVFYLTFFRTASRSFLIGQKLWTLINHSGLTTSLFYLFIFLVFLDNAWLSLGTPDVLLCSSACRGEATLTGALCDGVRRLSPVIINQNLCDLHRFWRDVSRFHGGFHDKLAHYITEEREPGERGNQCQWQTPSLSAVVRLQRRIWKAEICG